MVETFFLLWICAACNNEPQVVGYGSKAECNVYGEALVEDLGGVFICGQSINQFSWLGESYDRSNRQVDTAAE